MNLQTQPIFQIIADERNLHSLKFLKPSTRWVQTDNSRRWQLQVDRRQKWYRYTDLGSLSRVLQMHCGSRLPSTKELWKAVATRPKPLSRKARTPSSGGMLYTRLLTILSAPNAAGMTPDWYSQGKFKFVIFQQRETLVNRVPECKVGWIRYWWRIEIKHHRLGERTLIDVWKYDIFNLSTYKWLMSTEHCNTNWKITYKGDN